MMIRNIQQNNENTDVNILKNNQSKSFLHEKNIGGVLTRSRAALGEVSANILHNNKESSAVNKQGLQACKPAQKDTSKVVSCNISKHTNLLQEFKNSRDCLRKELFKSNEPDYFEEIELEDASNPVMMTQYVVQIFDYLSERELMIQPLVPNFVDGPNVKFTPRMRYILVDWLVQVGSRFNLLPDTVHLAIAIMDRYFQLKASEVIKDRMQLVGVTCMYLASKYEEMYPPEIGDYVYVTDNAYTAQDVRKFEMVLLETLDFYLSIPLPITFLRRYSRLAQLSSDTHNAAKYLCELTLQEYDLCHLPSNERAAAAICLSSMLFNDADATETWSALLQFHSGLRLDQLAPVIKSMAAAAYRQNSPSKFRAIFNKYKDAQFESVSSSPEMSSSLLRDIGGV